MPNSAYIFVLSILAISAAFGCDERPPLPDVQNIDEALEESVQDTADAADSHHQSSKDRTTKMKKRLDPDAG